MNKPKNGTVKVHSKKIAMLGVGGLVGGAAVFGFSSPAQAASQQLTYTCETALGSEVFLVTLDTDAPAMMHTGDVSDPVITTSTVEAPASLAGLLYGALGVRSVDGTAIAESTVGGEAQTGSMTVSMTPVNATGPLTTVATGTGEALAPTTPGEIDIVAGDFTTTVNAYDAAEAPILIAGILPATFPCTLDAGQNAVVDTVTVFEAPVDGADGADGTDGTDGTDGADGADGADGTDGTDGADGADGTVAVPTSFPSGV